MKKKNFNPQTSEEILAYEFASTFNDLDHLTLYLKFCQIYPHNILIKIFCEVKEIPESKIRKSKGALFTYLVKRYAHRNPSNLKNYFNNK